LQPVTALLFFFAWNARMVKKLDLLESNHVAG
jgi:hypothetical protein